MHRVRSVKLPLESNPIMLRITTELKKLKKWEESSTSAAETITIGLSGIADLYKCIGQFLSLPFIQQALCLHQLDQSFVELLEGSKEILGICSTTADITLQLKEASRNLQDSFHSNDYDLGISDFCLTRKQIIKSAKKTVLSLRRVERERFCSSGAMLNDYQGISVVIKGLSCVSIISISVLEALLYFLAMPVNKLKVGKLSLILKLMSRGKVACDGGLNKNELKNVNFALHALCSNEKFKEENVVVACERLNVLEVGLEGIQNGAESMFRQLTQIRTTLLEVFSS